MIKRLLMIDEMNDALDNGIVCFKVEEKEEVSHFFFTKNKNLISTINNGFSPEVGYGYVYDILNSKTLELQADSFDGLVYSVASCYTPDEDIELKDAKVYIGNKTGALVISDRILSNFGNEDMSEFGIKEDNKFFIFSACVGVKNNELEDIYLVEDKEA